MQHILENNNITLADFNHQAVKAKSRQIVFNLIQVVFFTIAFLMFIQLYLVITDVDNIILAEFIILFSIQGVILLMTFIVAFVLNKNLKKSKKIVKLGEGIFNTPKRFSVINGFLVDKDIPFNHAFTIEGVKYYEFRIRTIKYRTLKVYGTRDMHLQLRREKKYKFKLNSKNVILDII